MRATGEPEAPWTRAVEALALGTSEEDGPESQGDGARAALMSTGMNTSKSKSTSKSTINERTEVMATCGDGTSTTVSGRASEVGVVDESDMTGEERFEDSS